MDPLSSSHTDSSSHSPPDGDNVGVGLGTSGEVVHEGRPVSPFGGDHGMHDFHDNGEVKKPTHQPLQYRTRGHQSTGENLNDHPVMHLFGELAIEG